MKFAYKVVFLSTRFVDRSIAMQELNKLGDEGWELVQVNPDNSNADFWFKRRVEDSE